MREPGAHCSKMKMNGKNLSQFQFHFPGLLGTSLMSKQEPIFFFYTWTLEIIPFIHFGKQMDRTTIFFEMSKVASSIVIQLCYNELGLFSNYKWSQIV